jgi:hyperosmotically inducible periplasmic protein
MFTTIASRIFGLISLLALVFAMGCSATATSRSTGETVGDATLTAKVKTEIASEEGLGQALGINVDTYRGVVALSGFVDSPEKAQKAGDCARRVQGVQSVKNNLQVKPKS